MSEILHKRLATVKKMTTIYGDTFSEASIRWLIFNEEKNGFSRCIRRIGKRVLIDLNEFESWIDQECQGGM